MKYKKETPQIKTKEINILSVMILSQIYDKW